MSAELLRRAADVLRERAEAATPGRWEHVDFADPPYQPLTSDGEQSTFMGCGSVITVGDFGVGSIAAPNGDLYPRGGYSPSDDMRWVATVDPPVGLALADWLEDETDRDDGPSPYAEVVAQAVLRESDEGSEQ